MKLFVFKGIIIYFLNKGCDLKVGGVFDECFRFFYIFKVWVNLEVRKEDFYFMRRIEFFISLVDGS